MKKEIIDALDLGDKLEENPPEELIPQQLDAEEPHIDLQGESFLGALQVEEAPKKWRFMTWKTFILLGIPSICLIVAIVVFLVYFFYDDKQPVFLTPKGTKGRPVTAENVEPFYLENLTAIVRDLSGKQRIVLFGVAFVPRKGVGLNLTGVDQDMRIAASRLVGAMSYSELMNDKGREQVKKAIKTTIEAVKGAGVIEGVWITSWTIL
jgi:flagellar basal body-associated protein FliL